MMPGIQQSALDSLPYMKLAITCLFDLYIYLLPFIEEFT